ncbi:hypothetical protein [Paracoccus sp. JM45]|uniref:hypothetical protein n=1 Tax=Paracoccus sp. JM45 TaxID=2283626 RepID=UPI000E6C85D9|nr:hypothetical protein [Paracoccus sp. JM45]RJE78744.1 hypothetical protein DWB67_15805 [Paracoccus sp. JM45]
MQGSAPYLKGGFGRFYACAPEKFEYSINRFIIAVKRQMNVLNRELAQNRKLGSDEYTIANVLTSPSYRNLVLGNSYNAGEFLDIESYTHLFCWAQEIIDRPVDRLSINLQHRLDRIHVEIPLPPNAEPAKIRYVSGRNQSALPINAAKGEQHTPEFLAINMNGKLPAMDADWQGSQRSASWTKKYCL